MDNLERTPLVLDPPPNIIRVLDNESEEKLIDFLERTFEFGFDVETTVTKDFYYRRMRTMQFGTSKEQYVIDLKAYMNTPEASDLLYTCQGEYGKNLGKAPLLQKLLMRLTKYLCSDKWLKVGVNLGFEYECLYWQFGIRAFGWYDCMWAEKCIYAGLGGEAYLKNYEFYGMSEMFGRYFGKSIDKTLQTSFNLEDALSTPQYEYAALDTRTPLAIKAIQTLIANGETVGSLQKKGKKIMAGYLSRLPREILGDNLTEIIDIENGCLGSFVDMGVHGERLDCKAWLARTAKKKVRLTQVVKELDEFFLPIVGSKNEQISDAAINELEAEWKSYNNPTKQELDLKMALISLRRESRKLLPDSAEFSDNCLKQCDIQESIVLCEGIRKEAKEAIKRNCSELKKKRTKINNLAADCEGEALVNYSSNAQLMKLLKEHVKKLAKIENLDDETLEKYEDILVVKLIREYHGLAKEIGTYGDSWAQEWVTHACKEEGWLNPGDHRLHSQFNQYDAETGRSSSEKPNGQNIPTAKEYRSCFIADPPNEDIRISDCCESDTASDYMETERHCLKCGTNCSTHAEEQCLVTSDMAGAELRIIADDANDPVWINAFAKDEDVHSVGTELLYELEWPQERLPNCAYFKLHDDSSVIKNILCVIGEPQRKKCSCPLHKIRRDDNKSTNFLLAYGGGPGKLSTEIKKPLKVAKELMALHEKKNPIIWAYLKKSGEDAQRDFKAFDLFGRRRLLPEPTTARAKENCKERNEKDLRLDTDEAQHNLETFEKVKGRKPNKDEQYILTHREPTAKEIAKSYMAISSGIGRQGKNHRIQGTNATIAKLAMSSKFDENGKPYLWHVLPLYRAKLIKFVHDELVIQCPKQYGKIVAELVGDAFKRAAAVKMKRVVMEFDYHIESYWCK